jgi:hypothetical protein
MESETTSAVPFMTAHGIADSRVPTGHRRQKYRGDDVVRKMGTTTTSPKKTAYFMNLVHGGISNFI